MIVKKVMVFGTFDGLHPGHLNFLKQARKYGDYLVAVIARDETVKELKKRAPELNEKKRLQAVRKSGLVNEAKLGNLANPYLVIGKTKPDVICLGYDQRFFVQKLPGEIKKLGLKTKIFRLKPFNPEIYHTSKLKKN